MKTITVKATITYDDEIMYGNNSEAFNWFMKILKGNDLLIHENEELGDVIGTIKIQEVL